MKLEWARRAPMLTSPGRFFSHYLLSWNSYFIHKVDRKENEILTIAVRRTICVCGRRRLCTRGRKEFAAIARRFCWREETFRLHFFPTNGTEIQTPDHSLRFGRDGEARTPGDRPSAI